MLCRFYNSGWEIIELIYSDGPWLKLKRAIAYEIESRYLVFDDDNPNV